MRLIIRPLFLASASRAFSPVSITESVKPRQGASAIGRRSVSEGGGNAPLIEREAACGTRREIVPFLRGIMRRVRHLSGVYATLLGVRVIYGLLTPPEEVTRGLIKRPSLATCYLQGSGNGGLLSCIPARAKSPISSRRRIAIST